jgi:hypothetical protein
MHAEMAKKRDAEGRLFFSFPFRTDNPNGKLLPLDTIRSWVAQAAAQQKKANRQRPSGPAPVVAVAAAAATASTSDASTAFAVAAAAASEGSESAPDRDPVVESIWDRRTTAQGVEEYLVRWVGAPPEQQTCVPESELNQGCPKLVADWNVERSIN